VELRPAQPVEPGRNGAANRLRRRFGGAHDGLLLTLSPEVGQLDTGARAAASSRWDERQRPACPRSG
jgi:hypothetical protein